MKPKKHFTKLLDIQYNKQINKSFLLLENHTKFIKKSSNEKL